MRLLLLMSVATLACRAEDPVLIFDPLPQPLRLPPGQIERLPLDYKGSFFGDAIRVVDCPDDLDGPYGTCGNQLFGGLAMADSHMRGAIEIRFSEPVNNITHFEVYLGDLQVDDSELQAPAGYAFPLRDWFVRDAAPRVSQGDLNLATGGVTNLQFAVDIGNTGLTAIGKVNPHLVRPPIVFPGARGHAWAWFEQRENDLLDFHFSGSTFLPLGREVAGDPVRFPLPVCAADLSCASVLARGTSFHPHLNLSTRAPEGEECGAKCPSLGPNTIEQFTIISRATSHGDDFNIDNPGLGGIGPGRVHSQGRLQIQFGPVSGGTMPFAITTLVPDGLLAEPPPSTILGRGPLPGLIGHEEFIYFPLVTYLLKRVALVDEPYDFPRGAIDLRTGRIIGRFAYRAFFGQSIADVLFRQNEPRIERTPFYLIARYALFEKAGEGEAVFRFSGRQKRSFATYLFPSPDGRIENAFLGGPNSALDLFLNMRAIRSAAPAPEVRSGASQDLVSSLGERFSYLYSIPCDGASPASFEYTNAVSGTFRMTRLSAVTCLSEAVTFSAFGTWSRDEPNSDPRFASVQISLIEPYASILVFQNPDVTQNTILSSAHLKPAEAPEP